MVRAAAKTVTGNRSAVAHNRRRVRVVMLLDLHGRFR